jgi:excisionase family DNA binding protein
MNEIIDADQCAELLLCTRQQVKARARPGDLPGLKIGRSWLFARADLLEYLAEKDRADALARRTKHAPSIAPIFRRRRNIPPSLDF